ncbi:MAG TPA: ABC transporter substrate-binding protein [Stellaceae bacterium]|jgi:ABC-type nitrate/sulfonate/bicarbonate transport system substrate-binding protein
MRSKWFAGGRAAAAALVAFGMLALGGRLAAAQEPLRVGKGFPSLFQFTPLDVGIEEGIFKKHGVEVEASAFAGDARLQQAFAAGAIDLGIGSGPGMAFIAKGSPTLGVAEEAGPPLGITLCALASGPIKSVADLKGKTVSISSVGSQTEWMVRELSRRQGWGPDGIKMTALGDVPAQLSALRTHQVDAVPFDITTAYELDARGEVRILLKFGDIVKDYVNHVIYASNDVMAKRPDDVKKFLAGWFETIAFVKHNKAETVRIASAVLKIPAPVVSKVYDETMPMLSDDGKFNGKGLAVLRQSFVDMKMLPAAPDMATLYTEKFLPSGS